MSTLSHQFVSNWLAVLLLWIASGNTLAGVANDEPETGSLITIDAVQPRIYRNPEERREAGLGRRLADWLTVSGLLEIEHARIEQHFNNGSDVSPGGNTVYTLQLGADITFSEIATAELVFEGEQDQHSRSGLDEGLVSIDLEPWGFEGGRLYVPFGEYYSHFVEGPILEFGETRADALAIDYTAAEAVEIAAYVFHSQVNQAGKKNVYDWGMNLDYTNESESIRIGAGYISDLAESEEKLLAEYGNSFERQVPAWNAYTMIGLYPFEITAEIVAAIKPFAEFKADTDQPSAYNVEIAYFPAQSIQLAVRLEGSDKFADKPARQYGINWTWRSGDGFLFSIDYLRGKYKQTILHNDDEDQLKQTNTISAQIAVEF